MWIKAYSGNGKVPWLVAAVICSILSAAHEPMV